MNKVRAVIFGFLLFKVLVISAFSRGGFFDEEYLYQASIRHMRSGTHICSGSIIKPKWILTAAHCVYSLKKATTYVVVGTQSLESQGYDFYISKVIIHEKFDPADLKNDIALLELSGSMTFNSRVQPIRLSKSAPPDGVNCTLSGWGLTDSNSSSPDLQHMHLRVLAIAQCRNILSELLVRKSHLCTYPSMANGACQADSGGPLVVDGLQVGIVSWGMTCEHLGPYVFTSVPSYRRWIRMNTAK